MAKRRMFSMDIIDTDAFLEMPPTTQNLYFHLGMRADDDGFIANPNKIMKVVGANPDDIKILIAKRFIISFDNGIIVIKHWKINNYIQSDRYHPTLYLEQRNLITLKENDVYTDCIQDVSNMDTQVRLGKVRKGKLSQDKSNIIYSCPYFSVRENQHKLYIDAYPGIDIIAEYKKMCVWLESNPSKRKSNYPKFINNWLNRCAADNKNKQQTKQSRYEDFQPYES